MTLIFSKRRALLMLIDMAVINLSFMAALALRFDAQIPLYWLNIYVKTSWLYSMISLIIFCFLMFYDHSWRYMTPRNTIRLAGGTILGTLVYILSLYFLFFWTYPRSVALMHCVLASVGVVGVRLAIHLKYYWRKQGYALGSQRVLIIGAGDAGEGLSREMLMKERSPYTPICFLDDNPDLQGIRINRVPVAGRIAEVEKYVKKFHIQVIIIAIPSAKSDEMRRIVTLCEKSGAKVMKVPSLFDILDGKVNINEIRNVEPEDILGREQNIGDIAEIAGYLMGKTIMVTGAGGSIGSELCRQIMTYNPKLVILLDNSEFNVYQIDMELSKKFGIRNHIPVVGDVQSHRTMQGIFDRFRPNIVFHAAAYKHVPLMEANVAAAIKNNVWGTKNIATLAGEHNAERFVLISTDKAVNPTNVMGASKRMAEMVIQSMNGHYNTSFSAVRFGNVLGSNGSVLPLFKQQIAAGGPVTVTHPEVIRYFMTIPEAVQLVLTTGTMARGGEIYILEMGEPVKIVDMAKSLIRLSGFEPDHDIEIKFVGLRPGEKLYEELLTDEEGIQKTECDRILIGKPSYPERDHMFDEVEQLWHLANTQNISGILDKLNLLVPGFQRKRLIKATIEEAAAGFPDAVELAPRYRPL